MIFSYVDKQNVMKYSEMELFMTNEGDVTSEAVCQSSSKLGLLKLYQQLTRELIHFLIPLETDAMS